MKKEINSENNMGVTQPSSLSNFICTDFINDFKEAEEKEQENINALLF